MVGTANKQRGEVSVTIDGKPRKFCLTLGVLATLETRLGVTKPGELDNIIMAPTYNQLLDMTHELVNFREASEAVTMEQLVQSDLNWKPAYLGLVAAVKAANPEETGKDGEEEQTT